MCTSRELFPHYELKQSAELGESRQQLSKPESQQAALHWRRGLLDTHNTLFSELGSSRQTTQGSQAKEDEQDQFSMLQNKSIGV